MARGVFNLSMRVKDLFFDRAAVQQAVSRARVKVLSKMGAFVRTRARSLIKPARRRRVSELTPIELAAYKRAVAIAKKQGRRPPKLGRASSKPGEPPRSQTGLLRQFIWFAYDPFSDSTVVGPVKLNRPSGAPETLEHGGYARVHGRQTYIAPRPYMRPALEAEEDKFAQMWRDSIR